MYREDAASTFQRVVHQADGNVCIVSDSDSVAIRSDQSLLAVALYCLIEALC